MGPSCTFQCGARGGEQDLAGAVQIPSRLLRPHGNEGRTHGRASPPLHSPLPGQTLCRSLRNRSPQTSSSNRVKRRSFSCEAELPGCLHLLDHNRWERLAIHDVTHALENVER